MDLIKIERGNCCVETYPALAVSNKGALRFNKAAIAAYGLKAGDKVAFYQDNKQPIDWYIKFGEGVPMRATNNGSLAFNFINVARSILSFVKKDKALIRLATEPVDGGYYAILTRSA